MVKCNQSPTAAQKLREPVARSEAHAVSDGIMDHMVRFVIRNPAPTNCVTTKQPNFGTFVKVDVATTVPVVGLWKHQILFRCVIK
jgi:hypothetical protein